MLSEGGGIPCCQRMRFPTRREGVMLLIAFTITHFLALRVLIQTLLDRLEAADSGLGLVL
jgi:ABC-type maltose transport system permease subunit